MNDHNYLCKLLSNCLSNCQNTQRNKSDHNYRRNRHSNQSRIQVLLHFHVQKS